MTFSILVLCLLLAFTVSPSALSAELPSAAGLDADSHLAGWWKFDDATGTTAADSSPHGRDGELSGGLSFGEHTVPSPVGKALSFDGQDDLIRIRGYKGITGTGPRTISVWIKTTAVTGEIVSWGEEDFGRMWRLCFIRKHMGVHPEGGYYYMETGVHDDRWHHIGAVIQEAELPNLHDDVTLYLDGKTAKIDRIGLLDLWPIETGSDRDVTIGEGFAGAIDELRIYSRELSEEEIAALHAMGK